MPRAKKKSIVDVKKILGVTANLRNLMVTVALLFAFLGGFFQIYSWLDTTYAKQKHLLKVEAKADLTDAEILLNSMYTRYWTLDNMMKVTPNLPEALITEHNNLEKKIKLQEDKVKYLQEMVVRK